MGKHKKAKNRSHGFKEQCHKQDCPNQPDHSLGAVHVQGFPHQQPSFKAYPFPGRQNKPYAHRGNTQPANLNQQGHHSPPKHSKMVGGIYGNKPCDTNRACRCKQRVNHPDFHARVHGHWQQQQDSSKQDDRSKS